jgi:adenylate/nucleoside-diphosphate kinase
MLPIDRHRVKDFLSNFIADESRFGKLNPYTLIEYPKSYPLIYKDRIYYLRDEEERDYAMRNPRSLEQNQAIPKDVKSTPVVFITGKTKTGKTTLASKIREKFGFKVIDLEDILTDFVKEHEDSEIKAIVADVKSGKCLSDESLVSLIQKRTSLADCNRGWILDGLPLNKRQCELLNKKHIVPSLVISLKMTELEIKKRV